MPRAPSIATGISLRPPAKVADYLSAGTRLVWVIDPKRRSARIYQEDGTEFVIGERDTLEGGDVIPGFSCPLDSIF